jgi:hypothetical protein
LDFPVALAGEVLPIRGLELVFNDYGPWCDFCSPGQRFRLQMRLAIPVYLLLLYVPNLIGWIARRNIKLLRRIAMGVLIYTLSTGAFFWITNDAGRRGHLRIASVCLLILSAAAAVAWSNMAQRLKAAAICSVLLVGASVFTFLMSFIAPRSSGVNPGFVSYLVLLIVGIGGTLGLTSAIERALDWWLERLRSEDAG